MIEGSGTYAESEGMRRAERAKESFNRNSSQLMESTAGAFRVAGYKPGDTVTGDAVARVGRERALKFDELINDLIASAKAERMSEAGAIASSAGITGPNQEYYQNLANQYRQQADRASSGVLGSLQTVMDAAQAGQKKDQPEQPPTPTTAPDSLATYQTPQTNPYKGFDSLNVSEIFPKRKTNRFASPLFG